MRSSQLFFLLVLPFQMQISVSGQPSADCFVQGKCTESLYLHIKPKLQRELECLEHCGTVGGSSYFTYDSETEDCFCWQNCEELSIPLCSTCISGDVSCFEQECFVPNARINGAEVSLDIATDVHECAEECKAVEACNWFTFDSEDQACVLTKNRESVSTCSTCTYGHTDCIRQEPSGLTSLFTCGGYNDVDGYLVEAEVIDLSSDGSPPPENCRQVPDMLSAKYDHFAMWDRGDNSVLCCGGFGSSQGQRCYKYSGDEWSDMGDVLLQYRALSAAVQLSNGDYWISGGFSDGGGTSEYYQDGTFSTGPPLPYSIEQHCVVEVNTTFVFISGNGNSSPIMAQATFRFNPEAGTFDSLPAMTQPRYGHGCGVVKKGSSYDIIVAGGYMAEYGYHGFLNHSEIYNTGTGLWRDGPPLPDHFTVASSVQYEDTFLLVGGQIYGGYLDTIYQYDYNEETWILRPDQLSQPKNEMAAVLTGPLVAGCS